MAKIDCSGTMDLKHYLLGHPEIKFVRIAYTDARGTLRSCTYTSKHMSQSAFDAGFPFDASSIPMMQCIEDSDYLCRPDIRTAILDPFASHPTLLMLGEIYTTSGLPYYKCPRTMLRKATEQLHRSGVADRVLFGPEAEFFVFDNVSFETSANSSKYSVDGSEGYWNHGRSELANLAHRSDPKLAYMVDSYNSCLADLRSEILLNLESVGIRTEKHHHEVATCQMECNIKPQEGIAAGDALQILKYIVKNCASRIGKTATFMPKPLQNDNGSGMHINVSLWKDTTTNLFYDPEDELNLSHLAYYFINGVLEHCRAILAFACPTTNSYRRLVPGFEAPIHIAYSGSNRSTAIRVPGGTDNNSTRIEFRLPDGACCIYLVYAAILLAGMDGIAKQRLPRQKAEGNLFDSENTGSKNFEVAPRNLREALEALRADSHFLTKDGVFSQQFIDHYIEHKMQESSLVDSTPHPQEFSLYYGC